MARNFLADPFDCVRMKSHAAFAQAFHIGAELAGMTRDLRQLTSEPRKRVDLLVKAFSSIRRRRRDARLLIPRPRLASIAAQLESTDGVELFEPVASPKELAPLYRHAWVSVLPSDGEAFGLVLVEASIAGHVFDFESSVVARKAGWLGHFHVHAMAIIVAVSQRMRGELKQHSCYGPPRQTHPYTNMMEDQPTNSVYTITSYGPAGYPPHDGFEPADDYEDYPLYTSDNQRPSHWAGSWD